MGWEVTVTLCVLAGELDVTPGDLDLLRRLAAEDPAMHGEFIAWMLRSGHPRLRESLLGFAWNLNIPGDVPGSKRWLRRPVPQWLWEAYFEWQ